MKHITSLFIASLLTLSLSSPVVANPWNGKVVLQGFWWGASNDRYPGDWYTYLAKLAPKLRQLGIDGLWIPSPTKGWKGAEDMGYGVFDHYDLGNKSQKGTVATRFGDQDSLLRLIAVAHANGLDIYPDIVLNHVIGGDRDDNAPGNPFKRFRYHGFAGPQTGRWPKDHWNFHPNPDHGCSEGDLCGSLVGADICYLDAGHGGGGNGQYMRDQARAWFQWLNKQLDADGYRIDAAKHFPAYVLEDLLFNSWGGENRFFCAGEYVGGGGQLDQWAGDTGNRCGTFDFSLRNGLASLVEAGGLFDLGSLPDYQQHNRLKSSPFINNHDTWKGAFWDSADANSTQHDDRSGDWRKTDDEILPTIDPDNPRTDLAYAAAFAVDGSPTVYYEDLFINHGATRFSQDPATIQPRDYLVNLIWAHQKLDFKDGKYRVRYRGADLLVIERQGRALIGLNDHGNKTRAAWVETAFGANVALHDYSGSIHDDLKTNADGWVYLQVPPMSYTVLAPPGRSGGFAPTVRRTTQEFQLADDLGDADPAGPGYGGRVCPGEPRTAGAIWVAANTPVRLELYADSTQPVRLSALRPSSDGAKRDNQGGHQNDGQAGPQTPLVLEFIADREGYHQLRAQGLPGGACTRAYLKADYQAPRESDKF